jgi:3-hydroxyacyl-CoA dehydrogenase
VYTKPCRFPRAIVPHRERRLEAGLLGRKTGAGFYRHDDGTRLVELEEGVAGTPPAALWLAPDAAAPAMLAATR